MRAVFTLQCPTGAFPLFSRASSSCCRLTRAICRRLWYSRSSRRGTSTFSVGTASVEQTAGHAQSMTLSKRPPAYARGCRGKKQLAPRRVALSGFEVCRGSPKACRNCAAQHVVCKCLCGVETSNKGVLWIACPACSSCRVKLCMWNARRLSYLGFQPDLAPGSAQVPQAA